MRIPPGCVGPWWTSGCGDKLPSLAPHAVKPIHLEGHDFPGIDPSIPAGIQRTARSASLPTDLVDHFLPQRGMLVRLGLVIGKAAVTLESLGCGLCSHYAGGRSFSRKVRYPLIHD